MTWKRFAVRAAPYVFVGSLIVLAEIWLCSGWLARSTAGCGLVVPEEDLDIGRVWAQREFPWVLNVHNPTSDDIAVQEIKASCACTIAEPRSFVVPAGGAVPVRVQLNLWPRSGTETPQLVSAVEARFTPQLCDSSKDYPPWTVKGVVHRYPLRVSPAEVDFGDGLVQGDPFPARHVDVEFLDGATDLTASCDESLATVAVRNATSDGPRRQVEVSLRPDLPAGEYKFNMKLRAIVPPGGLPPRLGPPPDYPLEVRAVVGHDVYLLPASVPLGAIRMGGTGECTVTLRSVHGKPFAVTETRAEPADSVRVDPAGGDGAARTFRVSQRADRQGDQSSRVRFAVKEEGGAKPYEVSVAIFWHGTVK